MKKIVLLLILPLFSSAQELKTDLDHLTNLMQGSFNSELQSKSDTNYLNIKLDMVSIWNDRTDGKWLYVEQAVNKEDAKPYRQRVYHLQQIDETTFSSTIYKIDSANKFIGYHKNIDQSLGYERISELPGCGLLLTFDGTKFEGKTKKRACKNAWGEAAYATSEVVIYVDKLISWDRGWNSQDQYVWGAEKAGYEFVKQ